MKNECHDLAFSFGQNAFGVTKSTRKFSIKVIQLSLSLDDKNVNNYIPRLIKSNVQILTKHHKGVFNGIMALLALVKYNHLIFLSLSI